MNRKQRRESAAVNGGVAFVQAFQQAFTFQQAGKLAEAVPFYQKAMALNPNDAMCHNNFSVLLYDFGRHAEAEAMQRRAIKLDPTISLSYNNLGVTLNANHRHAEAIPAFRRAIELEPTNSRATNNLGDSLVKSNQFQEGFEMLERAIALDPAYAEAYSNRGMALWGLGRLDESIASIEHALKLGPHLAQAHKNLGIVSLMNGDYAKGWREYEWRPMADRVIPRNYRIPRWNGEKIANGMLLVWSEQGVGDEILYSSMIDDLSARGFRILWESDPRLVPLFQRSAPQTQVIARVIPPVLEFGPEVVAQVPIASLGQFFRPDINHFPRDRRSYLKCDKSRAAAMRASLGLAPGEKLVGISWFSKNIAFGENKSTALKAWADILRTPGIRFVDMQYGDTTAERAALTKDLGLTLTHIEGLDLHDDLDGVAALAAACDLVVTVSNTTAHLAGALGVPLWVMVPLGVGKFWYWGHNTQISAWYPSATIIRQQVQQNWAPTLSEVAARLRAFSAT